MAMTKADIVENVYEKVGGFSKKEAAEIVETVFDTIKETLERGEKIKISGFGNFVVRDKNARAGRNPQTGQEITISARRVLTFKPSQVLKNVAQRLRAPRRETPMARRRATPDRRLEGSRTSPSSRSARRRACARVKPYVLRYWETEFKSIKPQKTRSQQRLYRAARRRAAAAHPPPALRQALHHRGRAHPPARARATTRARPAAAAARPEVEPRDATKDQARASQI